MQNPEEKIIPYLVFCTDFQKNFNKYLIFKFYIAIKNVLNADPSNRQWVTIFYTNTTSTVNKGFWGVFLGCKQGNPVFPYISNLTECLAIQKYLFCV